MWVQYVQYKGSSACCSIWREIITSFRALKNQFGCHGFCQFPCHFFLPILFTALLALILPEKDVFQVFLCFIHKEEQKLNKKLAQLLLNELIHFISDYVTQNTTWSFWRNICLFEFFFFFNLLFFWLEQVLINKVPINWKSTPLSFVGLSTASLHLQLLGFADKDFVSETQVMKSISCIRCSCAIN